MLEEWVDTGSGAGLDKTYVQGHDVIAQASASSVSTGGKTFDANEALYLLADGHGSTRQLYGQANTPEMLVAERYAYDAYGVMLVYGNLVGLSAAVTSHLYSGEQTDALTGMQYLRARYYDPSTGRFNRVDPFAGNTQGPQSLHKYAYAHANPVMGVDPSGRVTLLDIQITNSIQSILTETIGGVGTGALRSAESVQMGIGLNQTLILGLQQSAFGFGAAIGVGLVFKLGSKAYGTIGKALSKVTRLDIAAESIKILSPYVTRIASQQPGARVGIRGSLIRGYAHPAKPNRGGLPFDVNEFDIDMFIVSDELAAKWPAHKNIRKVNSVKTPELFHMMTEMDAHLRNTKGFKGIKPGQKGFSIRVFTEAEIDNFLKDPEEAMIFLTGI